MVHPAEDTVHRVSVAGPTWILGEVSSSWALLSFPPAEKSARSFQQTKRKFLPGGTLDLYVYTTIQLLKLWAVERTRPCHQCWSQRLHSRVVRVVSLGAASLTEKSPAGTREVTRKNLLTGKNCFKGLCMGPRKNWFFSTTRPTPPSKSWFFFI